VTRARPTSPGTPRPFNCTRPSASLSAHHLSFGSGHCPAARSRTLGPLAYARRTPLFLRLGPAPLPRLGSCDMGLGTQPATHRSPMARLVTSATPGDRDQAASARTQHLMLSTPAPRRCASRHAESLLLPALYPRRNPNSGRATKAPDRYHYLGARTSSSTRGPPPSSPLDATSNHPPARPVLDSSRAARRDEQRRWGGSTPTTPLLSVRGCHKGFESPGQLNLPNISGMRKRAQVCFSA
jgi:hypothetical protein